jgi:RND family efflux transporter MFP subunit
MYAPMAGRIGRRQVDVGKLVGAGQSTLLATIVQLDPIYVYFAVPERDARNLLTQRAGGFPVTVTMAGQAPHPQPGRVDFVNNTVDPTTGTFQVRATVANREGLLLPGQYAQVRLLMGTRSDAILVPERAIVEEQGGQSVLVVGADKKSPAPQGNGGHRIRGPAHHRDRAQGRRARARRRPAEGSAGHAHRPEAVMTSR